MTIRNKNALRAHPLYSQSKTRAGLLATIPPAQMGAEAAELPLAYVIWRRDEAGLLSVLGTVLRGLEVARWLGATPVVDMANFFTAYSSDQLPQSSNFWNTLFEPLSALKISDLSGNNFRVLFSDGSHAEKSTVDPERIEDYRRQFQSHIRFSEQTRAWIEEHIEPLSLGENVIGVHYRGGDMRTAPRHPLPPTAQQLVRRSKFLLDSGDYDSLFLATNARGGREVFQKAFGRRVRFIAAPETAFSGSLPFSNPRGIAGIQNPRSSDMGAAGEKAGIATARNVLADVAALAQCGALVCGDSNVSLMAKVFATTPFKAISTVDNGRNGRSRLIAYTQWYVRRALPAKLGGFGA